MGIVIWDCKQCRATRLLLLGDLIACFCSSSYLLLRVPSIQAVAHHVGLLLRPMVRPGWCPIRIHLMIAWETGCGSLRSRGGFNVDRGEGLDPPVHLQGNSAIAVLPGRSA